MIVYTGLWNHQAIELVQEVEKRISAITEDSRKTDFLFPKLCVALQRENTLSLGTFPHEYQQSFARFINFLAQRLCASERLIIITSR